MKSWIFGCIRHHGPWLFLGTIMTLAYGVNAQGKPIVLVSIPPQAWLVRELAGEAVTVHSLLPVGANPHTFEPDIRQLRTLSRAQLALTIGLPFDRLFLEKAKHLNPTLISVAVDKNISKIGLDDHHHHHHEAGEACSEDGFDPHIWLSPRRFAGVATNTATALATLSPELQATMSNQLTRVVDAIMALDHDLQRRLAPLAGKPWVVYHPSWSYFAADYKLRLLTIEQDGKSPSSRHIITLLKQAKNAQIHVVFTEPQYDKRFAQAVADPLKARVEIIDPLQEDWPHLMRSVMEKLLQ